MACRRPCRHPALLIFLFEPTQLAGTLSSRELVFERIPVVRIRMIRQTEVQPASRSGNNCS
jgi:hypothetical protein